MSLFTSTHRYKITFDLYSAFLFLLLLLNIIYHLCLQFPQVMDILLAEFHKACIYTVPKHIVNSQSAWDSDAYERLDSIMRLYGALVQTDIRVGNATNVHGIEHGWAWLARFLNKIPANRATATALNSFLQVCIDCGYRF